MREDRSSPRLCQGFLPRGERTLLVFRKVRKLETSRTFKCLQLDCLVCFQMRLYIFFFLRLIHLGVPSCALYAPRCAPRVPAAPLFARSRTKTGAISSAPRALAFPHFRCVKAAKCASINLRKKKGKTITTHLRSDIK